MVRLHQCISSSLHPGGEWFARPLPRSHLEGTLLPCGFLLGLELLYLAALAVDRLAAQWRLPGAAAVLLLGLLIPTAWLTQAQPLGPLQVETLHRVSLALLIVYAGLKSDLRRIPNITAAGLRLGCGGVLNTLAITALAFLLLAPLVPGGVPPAAAVLAVCCLGAAAGGTAGGAAAAPDLCGGAERPPAADRGDAASARGDRAAMSGSGRSPVRHLKPVDPLELPQVVGDQCALQSERMASDPEVVGPDRGASRLQGRRLLHISAGDGRSLRVEDRDQAGPAEMA